MKEVIFIVNRIFLIFIFLLSLGEVTLAQDRLSKSELEKERDDLKIYINHLKKKNRIKEPIYRAYGRNIKDIIYDFNEKKFIYEEGLADTLNNPPYEIREMDGVNIKIKNINPFIYSVDLYELHGDQISNEKLLEGSQANSLKLEVLPFKELSINTFSPVNGKMDPDSLALINARSKYYEAKRVFKYLNELEKEQKRLRENISLQEFAITNKFMPLTGDTLASEKEIRLMEYSIKQTKEELSNLGKKLSDYTNLINTRKLDTLDLAEKLRNAEFAIKSKSIDAHMLNMIINDSIKSLHRKINRLNEFIFLHNQLLNVTKLSYNLYDSINAKVTAMLKGVGLKDRSEFAYRYLKLRQGITDNCEEIQNLLGQIIVLDQTEELNYKLTQNDIKNFLSNFNSFEHGKLIRQITEILGLIHPKNFEINYQTLSIAENADFIKYRIEFMPSNDLEIPQAQGPSKLDISFLINGGLKLDVSTGLILDFNLVDSEYYFEKFSSSQSSQSFDSVRVKKSTGTGSITPSINLFLNAYKRSSHNFKPGLSLGFGVSNEIRFRLYVGPSLIIGRRERIIFSSGLAFGPILRSADGYNEGETFEDNASLPTEVPRVQGSIKLGWYFGFGFNLSGKDTKGFLEKIKFK